MGTTKGIKKGDHVLFHFNSFDGQEKTVDDIVKEIGSGTTEGMYLLEKIGLVPALQVSAIEDKEEATNMGMDTAMVHDRDENEIEDDDFSIDEDFGMALDEIKKIISRIEGTRSFDEANLCSYMLHAATGYLLQSFSEEAAMDKAVEILSAFSSDECDEDDNEDDANGKGAPKGRLFESPWWSPMAEKLKQQGQHQTEVRPFGEFTGFN